MHDASSTQHAEWIELACLAEATARKPGNVHPGASFVDLHYNDFVNAAAAIAEPLAATRQVGLGAAIFNAVVGTRNATGTNVNLGIVLLLAPLSAVPPEVPLATGIVEALSNTTIDDAANVFAAIRHAQPGGMGKVSSQDISERPTVTLQQAMAMAAERDRIAEQYVTDYAVVFEARDQLCDLLKTNADWEQAIIALQIWMLSRWPDTLIARKCGQEIACEATDRAKQMIEVWHSPAKIPPERLVEFDVWLRADGHRRNPGTTADLIAAALYAAARDGLITLPSRDAILERAMRIQRG